MFFFTTTRRYLTTLTYSKVKMASRVTKLGKKAKAAMDTVKHPPFLKTFIPAQEAKPAPPLGPQLGKVRSPIDLIIPFSVISILPTSAKTLMSEQNISNRAYQSHAKSLLM